MSAGLAISPTDVKWVAEIFSAQNIDLSNMVFRFNEIVNCVEALDLSTRQIIAVYDAQTITWVAQ